MPKPKEEDYHYLGEIFNCPNCKEMKGVINGKEYGKDEYLLIAEGQEKKWGKVLSVSVKDRLCERCAFDLLHTASDKGIYLGNDKDDKRIELDFDKEKIDFILFAGQSGAGKSVFLHSLYKELTKKYSRDEMGFVLLDMTKVTSYDDFSDYLLRSVIHDPKEAISALQELAGLETTKKIFIHIEECDMVYVDRKGMESALEKIKGRDNFYITYSTSRLDRNYLSDWMKKYVNMKVVFSVATDDDSIFLLGNDLASHFQKAGERILAFNNLQIFCHLF